MTSISDESTRHADEELVDVAIAVRDNAYAPYSEFRVGAAVRDEAGRVFAGVNVENSSYGLTICAERVAAASAIAAGAKRIEAVAVVSAGAVAPCGACRQFLLEFGPKMAVLLAEPAPGTRPRTFSLAELLPEGFQLDPNARRPTR